MNISKEAVEAREALDKKRTDLMNVQKQIRSHQSTVNSLRNLETSFEVEVVKLVEKVRKLEADTNSDSI